MQPIFAILSIILLLSLDTGKGTLLKSGNHPSVFLKICIYSSVKKKMSFWNDFACHQGIKIFF